MMIFYLFRLFLGHTIAVAKAGLEIILKMGMPRIKPLQVML